MSRESDTRLFVGRLSRDVRERDLEDLFSRYGTIKNVSLKSTYGFVEFEDPRDAKDAVAGEDGRDFEGSRIVVEYSRGRRDRDAGGFGRESGRRDRYDDRDRGYGGGRGGDRYNDRRDRPPSRYSPPRNTDYRCIIEDLPSGCSWQDLKDHFRSAGDVCFADVRKDRGGRDYGIVEFKYEDDLNRAIEDLDRTRIRGTTVRVVSDFKGSKRSRSRDTRRSPSPRDRSPRRRSPSPRDRSPPRRSASPRDRSPPRRSPSPRRDSRSPERRVSPRHDSRSPRRSPSPRRSASPGRSSVDR